MKSFFSAAIIFFCVVMFTFAQNSERTHKITLEDYFTQSYTGAVAPSPDGKMIAFTKLSWDANKNARNSDIWTFNFATKELKQITSDIEDETSPQWGSSSDKIYFTAKYKRESERSPGNDGSKQIWQVDLDGINKTLITKEGSAIDNYRISKDGATLYYSIHIKQMIDEWKTLRTEFKNDLKFGHGIYKSTWLRKADINSGEVKNVHKSNRYIRYFEISPDGKWAALITDPDENLITHEGQSEVEILNIKMGAVETLPDELWREQAPTPYGWLSDPSWSAESKRLAFKITYDGYPPEVFAADWNSGKVNIKKIVRPDGVTVVGNLKWVPKKDELSFLGDNKARQRVYAVNVEDNSSSILTPGDVVIDDFAFAGNDGDLIAIQSTLTYASDLVFYKQNSESERLTNLNPQVDTWILPHTSIFEWTGANGDKVEGILELPPNYNGEKNLPLIVQIHGGPTASTKYSFKFQIYGRTAFATKGYAVLSPNYRGSTGYGDKFLADLIGRENDIEVEDILKGVDALIEKGIVDPERLGVMGWSNGGYLTNCLIATGRFKAASSGAGVIDQTMQWGEEDTPGHVINYMQALPWENPQQYIKSSPLYSFNSEIKTATIIHVGEQDERVPVAHSKTLHRALRHYIKAPTELIIYPGEPHGLTKYRHRLAKMMWDHAWFDKYLPADDFKLKKDEMEKR